MNIIKKFLSVTFAIMMFLSIYPSNQIEANASEMVNISYLQDKYPHGTYWNGGNSETYTTTPCSSHRNCSWTGSCGCNSYDGRAIQCIGFAYQLASIVYDCDPYTTWGKSYSKNALNNVKPGDIIRYRNDRHSIFVTNVSGDTITFADCNYYHNCQIRWEQTISKSTIRQTFTYIIPAPYEWTGNIPQSTDLGNWVIEDGRWTCYVNGNKVYNEWKLDSTGWCYVGADGYLLTDSWVMDSHGWCYVGANGYCVANSWMKDSVDWCYLNNDCRMACNSWVRDSIGWCYVGADGYMVYDQWVPDSNGMCYIGTDGYYVENNQ